MEIKKGSRDYILAKKKKRVKAVMMGMLSAIIYKV